MPIQLCTMELSNTNEVGSNKEHNANSAEVSLKADDHGLMDLDESLTNRKELIVESCKTNGHTSQLGSNITISADSLNVSECSVIDIPDSTPDVSCELVTSRGHADNSMLSPSSPAVPNQTNYLPRLGVPVRHSDIYITDVYNMTDRSMEAESTTAETPTEPAALETINEVADKSLQEEPELAKVSYDSVKLFRQVKELNCGDFLEPAAVQAAIAPTSSQPIQTTTVPAAGDTIKSEHPSYVCLSVRVKCTVMRTKAADGGTINELVSVQCDDCAEQSSGGTSGNLGDLSSTGSSDLVHQTFPPPPPPPVGSSIISQRYKSRFSHASSTSSTSASSIASSASALAARINAAAAAAAVAIAEQDEQKATTVAETSSTTEGSVVSALSHERISELRDKWLNSREVWRLLDYIDRMVDKGEEIPEPQNLTTEWRRGRKTKRPENEWTKPNEQPQSQTTPKPAKRRKQTNQDKSETSAYNIGSRVFAKWTDRRFYAATLVESMPDGRWLVEFYDGNRRPVSEEHMLYVDDLALIGQKVFARAQSPSEPGVGDDFQAGIVTGYEPDESNTRLVFTVARNDSDIRVPSKYIMLTEPQVRQVKKNPNANGDHRSSPLLTPAASRSTRSKTRCVTNRVDSPVPGSSGTQKRNRNRNASSNGQTTTRQRGRGRPRRQNTETGSGARNAVSEENRDDADYEDFDDDDDSVTTNCTSNGSSNNIGYGNAANVSGLEPEAAASYDASGRIKGKTVDGKATRFGREPREEETAALGPMPAPGTQPFKGMQVLLSCASETTLSTAGARLSLECESDYGGDGVSSCSSADKIDFKFSTRPFVKARLRAQLIAGGATVHESLEDVPYHKYGQTYLIANRPSRTAAYVACIAAGVRIYCHDWVIRCCAEGKCVPPQELPYGWSIEKERYFMSYDRGTQGSGCIALKRRFILISDGGDSQFTSYWSHVLKMSGANVKNLSSCDDAEVSRAHCVLCDCGHRDERAIHAHSRGVPLVTTTWLWQSLVHGELRKFDAVSSYRPDYVDHSD